MKNEKCPMCEYNLRIYRMSSVWIYICFHCIRVFHKLENKLSEVRGESILN